jgi:hypothetical protein
MKAISLVTVCVVLIAVSAYAQTPTVSNGTLDVRSVTRALDREFNDIMSRTTGPAWIGYSVAVPPRQFDSGCWSSDTGQAVRPVGPLKLEGPDSIFVLFRVEARRVDRIKVASSQCPLDGGGLTVSWLTGVTATASLDWLTTFASGDGVRRLSNSAIVAIAMHADPQAVDRLLALAKGSPNPRVRSDALFWVAQRAGDKAAGTIADAIDNDPDTEVKKKAVFALSQLPKDQGVPKLMDVARTHTNPAVRKQAMFWLGQSNDPRALKFFEEVLRK